MKIAALLLDAGNRRANQLSPFFCASVILIHRLLMISFRGVCNYTPPPVRFSPVEPFVDLFMTGIANQVSSPQMEACTSLFTSSMRNVMVVATNGGVTASVRFSIAASTRSMVVCKGSNGMVVDLFDEELQSGGLLGSVDDDGHQLLHQVRRIVGHNAGVYESVAQRFERGYDVVGIATCRCADEPCERDAHLVAAENTS
jgi:hypothetical protein